MAFFYSDNVITVKSAKDLYGTFWCVDTESANSGHFKLLECLGISMTEFGFPTIQEARSYVEAYYQNFFLEKQAHVDGLIEADGKKTEARIKQEMTREHMVKSLPSTPIIEELPLVQYFNVNSSHDSVNNQVHIAALPFSNETKDVFLIVENDSGNLELKHHQLKCFEVDYMLDGDTGFTCSLSPDVPEGEDATLEICEDGSYTYRQANDRRSPGVNVSADCVFTSSKQVAEYVAALKSRASTIEEKLLAIQPITSAHNNDSYAP